VIRPSAIAEGVGGWSWGCVSAIDFVSGSVTNRAAAHLSSCEKWVA
jgi:hypothetical protein